MQASGWIQFAHLYRRACADHEADGALSAAGARCERQNVARSGAAPARARDLSRYGRGSEQGARLEAIHPRHAALQHGRMFVHLRDSAAAKYPAAESARPSWS